ncbi:unnamed protein product [Lactuca saligna]|uniref:Uncharacterized protein n=1 Tax=Lactuca saligna TaxID=75948 RepID=A0AA35ZPC3_LACSI|nr:unnamed protein product [Lactuca saligna]
MSPTLAPPVNDTHLSCSFLVQSQKVQNEDVVDTTEKLRAQNFSPSVTSFASDDMAMRQRPHQKKYKLGIGRVNVSHSHKPGEVDDASYYYKNCLESEEIICLDRRITTEAAEGLQKAHKVSNYLKLDAEILEQKTHESATNALGTITDALSIISYSEILLNMKGEALLMMGKNKEVVQLCEKTLDTSESSLLKEHVEAQRKELLQRKQEVEEVEEKERIANENLKKKINLKEETAAAVMAARDAVETSLKLADTRATRLRERIEELTSQLEKLDTQKNSTNKNRPRYVCWPWEWLGLDPVEAGPTRQPDMHQNGANEVELSEPLL